RFRFRTRTPPRPPRTRLTVEQLEGRDVPTTFSSAQLVHAYGFDQISFAGGTPVTRHSPGSRPCCSSLRWVSRCSSAGLIRAAGETRCHGSHGKSGRGCGVAWTGATGKTAGATGRCGVCGQPAYTDAAQPTLQPTGPA